MTYSFGKLACILRIISFQKDSHYNMNCQFCDIQIEPTPQQMI